MSSSPVSSSTIELRKQQASKLFDEIDVNKDGTISKDELFNALRKLHLPTSPLAFEQFFVKIDTDGNQVIDRREFEAFVVDRYQELELSFEELLRNAQAQEQDEQGKTGQPQQQQQQHQHQQLRSSSSSSASSASIHRKNLTADSLRLAAVRSGVVLSDADVQKIMLRMDTARDDEVSFDEFVDYMLLCPCELNPAAFFDIWYTDAYVDDAMSDYTVPREIRLVPSGGYFMSGRELELHVEQPAAHDEQGKETKEGREEKLQRKGQVTGEGKSTEKILPAEQQQQQRQQQPPQHLHAQAHHDHSHHHNSTLQTPPTFGQVVAKKLVIGGIAGFFSRTLTAPIDRVRILMMTAEHRLPLGPALAKAMEGGVRSLWRGNGTNCLKITPEMAIKLLTFDLLKKQLAVDPGRITFSERLTAGAAAGLAAQATVYPLEVIRTRMAIAPADKPYKSILDCAKQTYAQAASGGGGGKRGFRVFYAGIVPSCIGVLPYAGIDLSLNSYLKDLAFDHLKKQNREVSVPLLLSCGMVSSSVATVCTFPLNVVRTKAQATGTPVTKIVKDIFTNVDAKTGLRPSSALIVRRLYAGMIPAVSKVAPATSISYASYDFLGRRWSH